jgi:hypothetical protein
LRSQRPTSKRLKPPSIMVSRYQKLFMLLAGVLPMILGTFRPDFFCHSPFGHPLHLDLKFSKATGMRLSDVAFDGAVLQPHQNDRPEATASEIARLTRFAWRQLQSIGVEGKMPFLRSFAKRSQALRSVARNAETGYSS